MGIGTTACVECSLSLYPPQRGFPLCTIATRPRLPEHCIEYAKLVEWVKSEDDGGRGDLQLDGDDPEHIQWITQKAQARALEYGITGVNFRLTQGVVKNIIPAVASTNAVVASVCAQEALKLLTGCAPSLSNYMMSTQDQGVYSHVFEYEKRDDCAVCSGKPSTVVLSPNSKLSALIEMLNNDARFQMSKPGLITNIPDGNGGHKTKTLYLQNPPAIEQATRPNLDKTLVELGLSNGSAIFVTDPTSATPRQLSLKFDVKFSRLE